MFERFTDYSRRVMARANQEAQRLGDEYIGTEHVLVGLVMESSAIAGSVLAGHGLSVEAVRAAIGPFRRSEEGPDDAGAPARSSRAKQVIKYAIIESRGLNHNDVGTEHLLLG
ncbi:MAG: hypothetical protein H6816_01105 [Phycisphaerales bacterium]|nr:hypothetical protein [Phycisphaerales bacterium]